MDRNNFPRIVIGGLAGDSGKTIVACGLLACFKSRGSNVSGFKKGPDYIDAAWLSAASGKPAHNLDSFIMGFDVVKKSFMKYASKNGINVIEGNRGIFDGVDANGKHSTAELAKLIRSPLIIIQNISKVTRTSAAAILGCKTLDPELNIAGVILNQVAGERHLKIARQAIEQTTGIPVLGAIPKLPPKLILPSRHLGLVTPAEHNGNSGFLTDLEKVVAENINLDEILSIARSAVSIDYEGKEEIPLPDNTKSTIVKIGYFKDKSFTFYYPENLEALQCEGAELIPVFPSRSSYLDDLDALYIGGGFPEMNLPYLTGSKKMLSAIKNLAEIGFPIYAECGGLMYLAEKLIWKNKEYHLAGVLPLEIEMNEKPQGHGYCEAKVDEDNPYYKNGTVIKGHEFHYSKIIEHDAGIKSCLSVLRGTGCFNRREGLIYKNVFAGYLHVHASAAPGWAKGMVNCARKFNEFKKMNNSSILVCN